MQSPAVGRTRQPLEPQRTPRIVARQHDSGSTLDGASQCTCRAGKGTAGSTSAGPPATQLAPPTVGQHTAHKPTTASPTACVKSEVATSNAGADRSARSSCCAAWSTAGTLPSQPTHTGAMVQARLPLMQRFRKGSWFSTLCSRLLGGQGSGEGVRLAGQLGSQGLRSVRPQRALAAGEHSKPQFPGWVVQRLYSEAGLGRGPCCRGRPFGPPHEACSLARSPARSRHSLVGGVIGRQPRSRQRSAQRGVQRHIAQRRAPGHGAAHTRGHASAACDCSLLRGAGNDSRQGGSCTRQS